FSVLSTLPFAVGQVQDAGLIFLSAIATSIVHSLHKADTVFVMEEVLATTLFTLCGSTALLGVALVITGKLRWASFVQYLPMPVVGGYFAFIGFFCLQAGVAMMSGKEVKEITDWAQLTDLKSFYLCAPGIVAGIFMWVVTQRIQHFTILPMCMLTILALFFGSMAVSGTSFQDARAYGWIAPLPNATMNFLDIYKHFQPSHFHAEFMLDQLPSWIAMYFVVAFSSSLDVAAIEMALHKPLDHNAELQTIGWSNVISGLTGGFTGSYIFSSTIFSMKSGVDSRLTGVLVFALELVLTFIAIDLTMEWMVHYANLWFTFVIVDVWNLEVGIVLGTIDARQASASFRDKHDFHLRTLVMQHRDHSISSSLAVVPCTFESKCRRILSCCPTHRLLWDSTPLPSVLVLDFERVRGIDVTNQPPQLFHRHQAISHHHPRASTWCSTAATADQDAVARLVFGPNSSEALHHPRLATRLSKTILLQSMVLETETTNVSLLSDSRQNSRLPPRASSLRHGDLTTPPPIISDFMTVAAVVKSEMMGGGFGGGLGGQGYGDRCGGGLVLGFGEFTKLQYDRTFY
ncbi:hypothetical protein AaE_009015, partial [Aphanomyces astaci]